MFSHHFSYSFTPTQLHKMEDQCTPLGWPYFFQEEEIELKHSLLYTTLELENIVLFAQDELAKKDEEILQLKNLLSRFVEERDDALAKCHRLGLEKMLLHQQLAKLGDIAIEAPPSSGTTTNEDQENALSNSSDSEENVLVVSPASPPLPENPPPPPPQLLMFDDVTDKIMLKLPLPEKGKFLQAVMEAGPLLQTLLLAGPLPQWQHPPPQLNSVDIPPVTISSSAASTPRLLHQDSVLSKKRALSDPSSPTSPNSPKFQKFAHQSSLLTCNI